MQCNKSDPSLVARDEEAVWARDQQLQGQATLLYHPSVQRNNDECKDEEAEWARDQQLQPFWINHLCSATMVTAKMKKLSRPETSSSVGEPLFWIIHLCRATTVTAKMKTLSGPESSSFNGKLPFWIIDLCMVLLVIEQMTEAVLKISDLNQHSK